MLILVIKEVLLSVRLYLGIHMEIYRMYKESLQRFFNRLCLRCKDSLQLGKRDRLNFNNDRLKL